MTYVFLTLKRVFKNKLNYIPFFLIAIFIPVMYVGIHNAAVDEVNGSEYSMQEELNSVREDIPIFENLLNSTELTEDEILQTKQNLTVAQEREKHLAAKVQAYQTKKWDQFYQSDVALIDLMINSVRQSPQMYGADLLGILDANQDYSEYMSTTGLGFDSRFAPVQGTSYAIKVFDDFYPIILILLLTYFASFVYCSSRVGGLDYEDLIPKSYLAKQMLRLLVGVIVGMIIILFLFGLCLLCGLIGSSIGGLQTPILFYTLEGTTKFVSIGSLLFEFLVLSILGMMLIVNLVAVFSRWMTKQMTCFFVSLIVVGGLMWCVQEIAPLHSFMQFLPFTYLNPIQIVTQELMTTTSNPQVNFMFGTIVLVISNLMLMGIYYWIQKRSKEVVV
ncbi:hypothetical protein [Allobaculum stercoricanis]|uniref:hypothetical protein n=1 Tax=Allobaculum stercoricanis TaxID=174709 RepID=UPI00037DD2B6|nr:hypothetical protein [Allobaculum stercoricanis]